MISFLLKLLISKDLHILLRYDKNWQPPPPGPHYSYATMGRFEGTDGFFEVSCAAGGGKTFDEFVTDSVKGYKISGIVKNECIVFAGTKDKCSEFIKKIRLFQN